MLHAVGTTFCAIAPSRRQTETFPKKKKMIGHVYRALTSYHLNLSSRIHATFLKVVVQMFHSIKPLHLKAREHQNLSAYVQQ